MAEMPIVAGLSGHTSPAVKARVVVPNDSTIVDCRALYVGTAGNINLVAIGDTVAVLHKNVAVGVFDIACSKVMATLTTAADIVAWN